MDLLTLIEIVIYATSPRTNNVQHIDSTVYVHHWVRPAKLNKTFCMALWKCHRLSVFKENDSPDALQNVLVESVEEFDSHGSC